MSTLTPAYAATLRRRDSSSSTVKGPRSAHKRDGQKRVSTQSLINTTVWIHFDRDSTEDILLHDSVLESTGIRPGDLIEIKGLQNSPQARDFQPAARTSTPSPHRRFPSDDSPSEATPSALCLAAVAPPAYVSRHANFEVSLHTRLASAHGFRPRSDVEIRLANCDDHTASHVEFSFRDVYLARSDMWHLVGQELAGKVVHAGQRITFLGSVKLLVKAVHVKGHRVPTGYFSGNTIPVFRSEAARYVIFIQMSREMWDFDSEGDGEILFNRVINGFLPDLFKRWTDLEVRHLVSIVLFGRQEYNNYEVEGQSHTFTPGQSSRPVPRPYQDFYKVVVTDMASAQWTTILGELKKNFKVFLRDVSLHPPGDSCKVSTTNQNSVPKITGRLSTAMKGNILEAITMASTQFSNDYVDRDLIRTGISVVVVTASSGVFEVDKDLLNLTSENLTNNGIGIDVVCLSKMPLHSVPLFKYRAFSTPLGPATEPLSDASNSPPLQRSQQTPGLSAPTSFKASPLLNSFRSSGVRQLSRYSSSIYVDNADSWLYGIPQWIDLSYWSPIGPKSARVGSPVTKDTQAGSKQRKPPFVPRVRMYEVQMMGLMEMGMAEISVPWMSETQDREPHKRRHRKPLEWLGSRSLSQSPNVARRSMRVESGTSRDHSRLATNATRLSATYSKMDTYDGGLFKKPVRKKRSLASPVKKSQQSQRVPSPSAINPSKPSPKQSPVATQKDTTIRPKILHAESSPGSDSASMTTVSKHRSPAAVRAARNASYALRGLAPPIRAVASTEINIEHAQAQMPRAEMLRARPTVGGSAQSIRSLSLYGNVPQATAMGKEYGSDHSQSPTLADTDRPSTPIRITNTAKQSQDAAGTSKHRQTKSDASDASSKRAENGDGHADTASSANNTDTDDSSIEETWDMLPNSVPKSSLPFIRNVNASNPLKGNANRELFFGRWQHLYPRKPRAATVKWRSLCTPASVPLTTEDFPTKDELETDFDNISYVVTLGETEGIPERAESRDELLREMLALRFAHGYQLVVGPRMNKFEGPGMHDASFFFNPDAKRHDGQYLFMSMGNTVQKLSLLEKNRISIIRYQRKPLRLQETLPKELTYQHLVRTILSNDYTPRKMHLQGFAEEYPWEEADNYLADQRNGPKNEVQRLRFWRARFVLLPVEPPANASRHTTADSEENDEEIHLRGIRALTQIWQKIRYIPPEDRRPANNRMSTFKPKDRNPLRVAMETLNPSELVATELDKLLAAEEAGDIQTTQLLPEEQQFDRESVKLAKIAAALQGERGIEIKNRRWHLRLHYSCFDGEEFTNWLVQNVRDIDTREEAVDFGNELMKEGLFEHVNSRHNFKDGNFFYSIKSEWRLPKPADLKQSWLPASRRSDKSVPPTPAVEQASKEVPATIRTRSTSSLTTALNTPLSPEVPRSAPERKRLAVSLSKMIRLDVDTKRRSNRPEIVSLHYDRLHNPENCYHLELSWLNVTSKLVDDAIVSWTTTAERYGLKLVEVPIVEAARVPDNEPFRAAYTIKIAVPPPQHPPTASGNVFFTASSFTPQPALNSDRHFYQKALLRRFNFVLDLEGVSDFPENVEISYSWGKLEYKYTQFVHRSGVILAQITDEGDILLLANRLYNSRLASAKETTAKLETTKQLNAAAQNLRPAVPQLQQLRPEMQMQASGIIGINVQSPSLSTTSNALLSPSPLLRPLPRPLNLPPVSAPVTSVNSALASAVHSTSSVPLAPHLRATPAQTPLSTPGPSQAPPSNPLAATPTTLKPTGVDSPAMHATPAIFDDKISADVFGSRRALASASLATYITPEQIKDELERFCSDPDTLNAFYAETQQSLVAAAVVDVASPQQQQQQNGNDSAAATSVNPDFGAADYSGIGSRAGCGPNQTPNSKEREADRERDKDIASASASSSSQQQAQSNSTSNTSGNKKRNSSSAGVRTGSSLLRPVPEQELEEIERGGGNGNGTSAGGGLGGLGGIPEMRLPESLQGNGNALRFWGVGRRRGAGGGGGGGGGGEGSG